ncbi:MAG: metal-dependent hydrolase [Pseudomonadota bacterium]
MKITWLGHAGFRIEIGDQILLVDPWMTGNPVFPQERRMEAIDGATHILVSHGHADHASDAVAVSRETSAPIAAIVELASYFDATHKATTIGFNKGGTLRLGSVDVTMVHAVHSSSAPDPERLVPVGAEAGFMISHAGRTIYFSGDTDVTADMAIMQDLHTPEVGLLCCGGHFTMDMRRAAYAARTFFDFRTVVPCHFKTFPLLAQSAQPLVDALPEVDVRLPDVLETLEL